MSMGKFHFTKNTVEASIWCNTCRKMTNWRVLNGKRGYRIPCYEAKRSQPSEAIEEAQQMDLFKESK